MEPRFGANRPENWCLSVPQKAEDRHLWIATCEEKSHLSDSVPSQLTSHLKLQRKIFGEKMQDL